MPKFKKVDANTIRIIVEKSNDVPLAQLLDNKKQLLEQKKALETTLKNIDEILEAAKGLGITAKPKKAGLNIPKGNVLYKEKGGAPNPKPRPKPRIK